MPETAAELWASAQRSVGSALDADERKLHQRAANGYRDAVVVIATMLTTEGLELDEMIEKKARDLQKKCNKRLEDLLLKFSIQPNMSITDSGEDPNLPLAPRKKKLRDRSLHGPNSVYRRVQPVPAEGRPSSGRPQSGGPPTPPPDSMRARVHQKVKQSEACGAIAPEIVESVLTNLIEVPKDENAWDNVVGQEGAKRALREAVILPARRPELFTGLRKPASSVLLYGPPGTGKTMLARAVSAASGVPFFSISASALVAKYLGESEQRLKALFAIARAASPSIIWVDEVDAILSARGANEHDAMRRLKTEFMVQVDGIGGSDSGSVFLLAATNRPADLDTAVLRRFNYRFLIEAPDANDRTVFFEKLISQTRHSLTPRQFVALGERSVGYSFSDLATVCRNAAMQPLSRVDIETVSADDVPPVTYNDVLAALENVPSSLSVEEIEELYAWGRK